MGGLAVSGAALAFPEPYCARTFTNAVEPITHVAFAGIDNTTGAAVNGTPADEDFTAIVGDLHPGSAYSISMSGNSDGNFTNYFRVYIDWNHDGVFNEDASERYEAGSITNSTGVDGKAAATTLIVPPGALTGQTRMRAVKKYNDPGAACSGSDASGTSYGQAEDYTVNVDPSLVPPPTLSKSFAPTNADASLPSTLTISLGANASSTPLTLTADLVDPLPSGMTVAATPNASTTCTAGVVTATAGAASVTLASGAQIPPANCSISVDVQVAAAAIYVNTIPANALQTNAGNYGAAASATYQATAPGVITYGTGFESPFTVGAINGQQGWAARSVNVATTTPANGAQHLSITATASPSTTNYALALSPIQTPGTTAYSLISANVRMTRTTNGANWRFNPQDSPEGLVTSILQFERSAAQKIQIAHFAPDGTATIVDTGATWPTATYFNIKLIVERATGALKICKDNVEVYNDPSGDSVAGTSITDLAVSQLSGSGNTAGNTFFADDLVIDNTNIGSCNGLATPAVAKSFAPAGVVVDTDSTATITLSNPNASAITLSADLVDTLPAGLVASAASTTCGGTASFTAGTLTLASGATIPPGSCTLTGTVQAATAGSYVNTIPAGALQTGAGNSASDASATLTVTNVVLVAPTVAKAFAPASVAVSTDSTATITLANPNASAITLSADLVDTLPAGLVASAASTTCGGTASFTAGSLTLSAGASIPASGSCTLIGTVQSAAAGSFVNTIAAGSLQTGAGNNGADASATLTVVGAGGVVCSGPINHLIGTDINGTSVNWASGAIVDADPASGYDINLYNSSGLRMWWNDAPAISAGVAASTSSANYTVLTTGAVIGPASTWSRTNGAMTAFQAGTDGYLGFRFNCAGSTCYGYAHLTTTGTTGFPATLVDYCYDSGGAAITIPAGPSGPPTVAKSFTPASVAVSTDSTATITLSNTNASAITLTADLVDLLPAGLVASSASTTCGGTASFTAGTLTLASGATIPPGSCTLSGMVQAAATGSYDNTIDAGDLQTDAGSNAAAATATLTVTGGGGSNGIILSGPLGHLIAATSAGTSLNVATSALDDTGPVSGNWDFNFWASGGNFTLWQINTYSSEYVVDGTGKAIVLHAGDIVGPALTYTTTGSSVPAAPEWLAGTDGYLGVKFNCDGRLTNPVPSTVCYGFVHITTTAAAGFPATIVDTGFDGDGNPMTIPTTSGPVAPTVAKSFAPASVAVSTDSTATITLTNTNATAITLSADLVDTLPAGLVASAASTTCTGTASFTAGTLTLASGATIPPGSCTLSGTVQSATAGSYVNTIAAGSLQTDAGNNAADASATLTVTGGGGGTNGIILSGPLGHAIAETTVGTSMNIVTSAFDDTGPTSGDWDFNFWDSSGLTFYTMPDNGGTYAVDANGDALVFHVGDVIGSNLTFAPDSPRTIDAVAEWLAGTDGYLGVRFNCDGRLTNPVVGGICYGYVHITSTGATGFPATIVDTAFDGDGNAITIVGGSTGNDPSATVAPASLSFTVVADATATDTLNIANAAGSNALTYSITSSGSSAKRPLLVPHVAGLSKGRVGNARSQDADKLRYLEQLRQQPRAMFSARGMSSSRVPAPWSPRAPDGAITFVADDGTYETEIGLNNGVATSGAVYANRFSASEALTIDSISIEWPSLGGVTTGMQPNLVVYYDAGATGDITNAVRLGADQIVSIDSLDAFQTYTTSFSVPGAGDVYIGFVDEWGLVIGGFPGLVSAAALDSDSPSVTYVSGSSDNTLLTDIVNLANNDLTGAGSDFGLDGAWLVRATGTTGGGAPCTGPVVSWLSASPASGSVAGGNNVDVTITANPAAGGLAAGSYTAELCVTTNDPSQPVISVPVSLTVTPAEVLPCSAADTLFCDGFDGASTGGDIVTGTIDQAVVQDGNGSSFDFATGDYHGYDPSITSDDVNLYFLDDPAPPVNPGMIVYWYGDAVPTEFQALVGGVVDGNGQFAVLHSGDTIGPSSTVSAASTSMDNWFATSDGYVGVAFYNEGTGALNFGYIHLTTTAPEGFPAQVLDYGYDASGAAITIP
jgi:hypothetical protein